MWRWFFRREPGDLRPPLAHVLRLGPSPNIQEYLHRDPAKVIKAGKVFKFQIGPENYKSLRQNLDQTGYPAAITRVELVIREVGFEDGSMIYSGKFYLQDPVYPNDPTKKIPVSQSPGAQNQKNTERSDRTTNGLSFVKSSPPVRCRRCWNLRAESARLAHPSRSPPGVVLFACLLAEGSGSWVRTD